MEIVAKVHNGRNGGKLKSGNWGPRKRTSLIPIVRKILGDEWEAGKALPMPNGQEVVCSSYEEAIAHVIVALATKGNPLALEYIFKIGFKDDDLTRLDQEKEEQRQLASGSHSMLSELSEDQLLAMYQADDDEECEVIDEAV